MIELLLQATRDHLRCALQLDQHQCGIQPNCEPPEFAGEFYILNGAFQSKITLALIAVIGVALAAFYTLRMYQKVMHAREYFAQVVAEFDQTHRELELA